MKTYLLDILKRIKRKSEELDAKTVLCNTPWKIFNDDGVEEAIHFRENGTLLVVINGRTTSGTWEIFVEDRSVHIMYDGQKNGIMLKPAFKADGVLAMQLDGTEQYAFLVDKSDKSFNKIKSLTDLNNFYKQIEQKNEQQLLKETEEKKKKEEAERIKREAEILEKERLRKLEEERVKKNEYLNKCLKERAEQSRNFSNANRIFDARNYSVEEMVYEINVLREDKKFMKFLKYAEKVPDFEYYSKTGVYKGWFYDGEGSFVKHFIMCIVVLLFNFAFLFLTIISAKEEGYTWIWVLLLSISWLLFTIWVLKGMIGEMILDKRVQFLEKNLDYYYWPCELLTFDEIINFDDNLLDEMRNNYIVEKYREIFSKRLCLIIEAFEKKFYE